MVRHFCKSEKDKKSVQIKAVLLKADKVCSQSKFRVKITSLKSLIRSALVRNMAC